MLQEILKSKLTKEEKSKRIREENPHIIAEELKEIEDISLFIDGLTTEVVSWVLEYVDEEFAAEILNHQSLEKTVDILNEMSSDDAIDIIQELDNSEQILQAVDEDIKILDEYEDDQTGSIMATDMLIVNPNITCLEAFEILIKNACDVETIDQVFVISNGSLIGTVELKKLIVEKEKLISEVMNTNYLFANSFDLIEDTVKKIRDYDLNSIPVLENDRLVGIVTVDDAMENYHEEIEDDYAKFSGLTEEENINKGVFSSIKKRVPWLLILLVLDLVVSLVISNFENVIESLTILVSFQPVILGLSGNAGTQALAVCVRGLSDDEISGKKAFKHIFKEFFIGGFLGIIIGLGIFLVVLAFLNIRGLDVDIIRVALVVGLSTLIALLFSSTFGAIFPIVLNKMKIDPAMASGPFITTINDCIAIVIYFSLASILLLQFM